MAKIDEAAPGYSVAPPRREAWRLLLIGMWGILAAISLLILLRDAMQPKGLAYLDYGLPISYAQRLGPLAALLLGVCGIIGVLWRTGLLVRGARLFALAEARPAAIAGLAIAIGFAGALAAVWILRAFPNSSDEYDYLFAAKTILAGRLWNPAPPLPDLFAFYNLAVWHGMWFSVYPPGWPALLAAIMALQLPAWLAGPLAGGLLLFLVLKLGQRRDGAPGGILAVAVLALSAFFVFNAGSYFNILPAAAAGALFCWAGLEFLDRPRFLAAITAGAALGALGMIRPVDVVFFGLPFAVEFLCRARRRHWLFAGAIILAGLPFLAALLFYNKAAIGSFIPGILSSGRQLAVGRAAANALGRPLPPVGALHLAVARIIMFAEWTSPLLVFAYVAALPWVLVRRRASFIDFLFPAFLIGFAFIPLDGGNQYGPRYYFEGFPFLVLTIVSALVPLLRDAKRPCRADLAASFLFAHIAVAMAAIVVNGLVMRALVDQRMDVYDQVRARHLQDAVVVIASPTSPLRVMWARELTRNGIAVGVRPVLYVRDLPDELDKLRRRYPARRFYVYKRRPLSPKGSLRRLW